MSDEDKPRKTLQEQAAERKEQNLQKRKRGRPKKTEVAAKKQGNRGVRGRPKGDAAIINEYKARMLNSPKSEAVLRTIFDAALNDDHKHQSAAWKIITDRILPVGAFEKDVMQGTKGNAIQINITGVGSASVDSKDITDGDFEVIEGDYE